MLDLRRGLVVLASLLLVSVVPIPAAHAAATSDSATVNDADGNGRVSNGDVFIIVFDESYTAPDTSTFTLGDDSDGDSLVIECDNNDSVVAGNSDAGCAFTQTSVANDTLTVTIQTVGTVVVIGDGVVRYPAGVNSASGIVAAAGGAAWNIGAGDTTFDDTIAPVSTGASVNDADGDGVVSQNDVITLVFDDLMGAVTETDTVTVADGSDADQLVVECDSDDVVTAGRAEATCTFGATDDIIVLIIDGAGTPTGGGDGSLRYSATISAISANGIEDDGGNDWNLGGGSDVSLNDTVAPRSTSADVTTDAAPAFAVSAGDELRLVFDDGMTINTNGSTFTVGDGSDALVIECDTDNGLASVNNADATCAQSTTAAPNNNTLTITLNTAGTATGGDGSVSYPATVSAVGGVADDDANAWNPAAGGQDSVFNLGPFVATAVLSVDGAADSIWDDIDDVLTIRWSSNATFGPADIDGVLPGLQISAADLQDLLGTTVTYAGASDVTLAGSGTSEWTLRIQTAGLTDGVALGDSTNGTSNADVTNSGKSQVPASNVTLFGGNWVKCGDSVAGVPVNSRCIVGNSFQTSTNGGASWITVEPTDGGLDLDVFLAAGLVQVQVVDHAKVDQYELVTGGPISLTTQVRMTLNLGDFDPVFLIGTGDLVSYATTTPDGSDNTATITARPSNASYTWAVDCFVGSCGNDSTQATVDYVGNLTFAIDSLANHGLPANFVQASRGSWVMTDAQSFGTPSWNTTTETFDIDVAAPHLTQSGAVNTGEFKAFIPDAMFGTDFFDVTPAGAVFSATAGGSSTTATATVVPGGVEVEVTGYSYSSPTIAITATEPAPSGGGGGGGTADGGFGSGTTTETVPAGGTVSSGSDATSDKPTKAEVTSPVAGTVSITPKQSTTTELSSGQTLLNVEVDITAPAATPQQPLVLDFELDASLLSGVDLDRLVVYRNGEAVRACTDPTAAVPDPCLAASSSGDDGDLVLTVRTSQASTWNFATVDTACPSGLVPAAAFADVATGSTHASSIDCAAWWRLVSGTTSTTYTPADTVSRGQVASVLRSLLETAGAELPSAGDRFSDDDPTHGEAAEVLAAAGVLSGTSATTFGPGGTVSRGQLASMLVGAYEHLGGSISVADADPFADDDTSVHADSIAKAVAAGFVNGITADTYDPDGDVTREQLATFVTNVLSKLVDDDLVDPPL